MDTETALKKTKKEDEYRKYIAEHISNVKVAAEYVLREFVISEENKSKLLNSVFVHDSSKLSPEEFDQYREKFYPYEGEPVPDPERFENAWKHHYQNNSHHPEYYGTGSSVMRMSIVDIYHMFADWLAMSFKFNNTPSAWYKNQGKKIRFHVDTRTTVEGYLDALDRIYTTMVKDLSPKGE